MLISVNLRLNLVFYGGILKRFDENLQQILDKGILLHDDVVKSMGEGNE